MLSSCSKFVNNNNYVEYSQEKSYGCCGTKFTTHTVSHVGNSLNAGLNEFLIPYLFIYFVALA